MTTFTVEIHEDIVAWLKKGTRPEIVLDLPSVPEPGDKLWLKSMRDAHIVEMERCIVVESRGVSRLRPTVRLVLLFGITTNHRPDQSVPHKFLNGRRTHTSLTVIIHKILSEQTQEEQLRVRNQMNSKLELLKNLENVSS
ncbi:Uncharacterised protein [Klebsiella quasipneumoniae]|uniref:hypothetical protein n=1 Tax=Klebsiella quasipneumoniae TaxID=1463165 RepID=UPI00125C9558|nr:hypothetical protein [Klebsiella quasipneumoniae]VAO94986.1 Uncharacterised protein [Klebsiella quasipneumoniae]